MNTMNFERLGLGILGHQHDDQRQQQSNADEYGYQRFRGTLCHARGGSSILFQRERMLLSIKGKCLFGALVVTLTRLTRLPECVSLIFLRSAPSGPQ
jgi:hypothetical protein